MPVFHLYCGSAVVCPLQFILSYSTRFSWWARSGPRADQHSISSLDCVLTLQQYSDILVFHQAAAGLGREHTTKKRQRELCKPRYLTCVYKSETGLYFYVLRTLEYQGNKLEPVPSVHALYVHDRGVQSCSWRAIILQSLAQIKKSEQANHGLQD